MNKGDKEIFILGIVLMCIGFGAQAIRIIQEVRKVHWQNRTVQNCEYTVMTSVIYTVESPKYDKRQNKAAEYCRLRY